MPVDATFDAYAEGWLGTADDLASAVHACIEALDIKLESPSVRTIRLWRAKGLLPGPKGSGFVRRHLVAAVAAVLLFGRKWSTAAIKERMADTAEGELRRLIEAALLGGVVPRGEQNREARHALEYAEQTAVLLAQGVLKHYRGLELRRSIARQRDEDVPPELKSAMSRLGRLYLESGSEDRAASLHEVVDRCRYALNASQWGIGLFATEEFRFADAVLVEPDLRVPTSDCSSIALSAGGFGEANVVEDFLFRRLRTISERLGSQGRDAYSAIRELVVRHSLVDQQALYAFLEERRLPAMIASAVVQELYQPVPEAWTQNRYVMRCAQCRTLLRPHRNRDRFPEGYCPIRQCKSHRGRVAEASGAEVISLAERPPVYIALPEVLTYWTGPGLVEIAIYDCARSLGLPAQLYPEYDLCDVAISGREIGIDAKSYSSPVSLAVKLNQSIGGLAHYKRRIVVVDDDVLSVREAYLPTLRDALDGDTEAGSLEVLSFAAVRTLLREVAGAR